MRRLLALLASLACVVLSPRADAMLGLGISMHSSVPPNFVVQSINVDFASANGGDSRTACVSQPFGGTPHVYVDSNAATVTTTATSCPIAGVTFTVPATASSSDGNGYASQVTVYATTGTHRTSGVPGNYLWYMPAYYGVAYALAWTAQDCTTSSGAVTTAPDLTGNGYTLVPQVGGPAYSSTGGGSGGTRPYWTFAANTENRLHVTSANYPGTGSDVGTWSVGANLVSGAYDDVLVSMRLTGNASMTVYTYNLDFRLYQYSGTPSNAVTVSGSTDFDLVSVFTGSSTSSQILNGGAAVTGGSIGTLPASGGVTVGGIYPGNGFQYWDGRIYGAIFWPSVLDSTAIANAHAYWVSQGL